ncbi:PilX N-terminal domain-containing pilus assembly protein [Pseudomonas sp. BIOMIG1BAC]|uniref:pilus assembly PilX family protein n=1 Tax=unclassified Pseudomonas TaxID=196821 RepID=UPI000837C159|nr:PilX N-terminal domain-containing pilus assembly protein [Pseudomonas sp. BIOMIG1BAC]QIH10903.1 hypothetical protein ATY02_31290 [Pseudomonas sp. BIOMIG1BAC]
MALLTSLVFLSLLTMIGLSAMHNALLQEKMAASLALYNRAFQSAETALREGEGAVRRGGHVLAPCGNFLQCAPPEIMGGGGQWIATKEGYYRVQNLGVAREPVVELLVSRPVLLFRVTAVGFSGPLRSVLESIYAHVPDVDRGKLTEVDVFSGKMLGAAATGSSDAREDGPAGRAFSQTKPEPDTHETRSRFPESVGNAVGNLPMDGRRILWRQIQ